MDEDQILDRIDLERQLARLHPADRDMMLLIERFDKPDDWTAEWPPRFSDIGIYIGLKYRGKPLSEAAIRYRRNVVIRFWRGERKKLRRSSE